MARTKQIKIYYQLTQSEIIPPSPEATERKNEWIRGLQKTVEADYKPLIIEVTYRLKNREVERLRKFFEGPVVEYWLIQHSEHLDGRPENAMLKRARNTLLYNALGYEVELLDGTKHKERTSTTDFTDTQEWTDFLETLRETEFEPNGYEMPDSKLFWELAEKHSYDQAREVVIKQLQDRMRKRLKMPEEPKAYIFTKEIKKWGVEAGDYYDERRHRVAGGTEKLLADGIIEVEE